MPRLSAASSSALIRDTTKMPPLSVRSRIGARILASRRVAREIA